MNNEIKKQNFTVLAVPCDRTFTVSSDKKEAFLNCKLDPKIKKMILESSKKLKLNNDLTDKGPILIKKLNKK